MNPVTTNNNWTVESSIDHIVERYGIKPSALIMILQDIQKHYKYLPKEALNLVSEKLDIPKAQLYGVSTFYKSFSLTPKGKNHICVCTGTACHVRQATVIIDKLERELKIKPGETTADGEISFETVNCLGACALGPLVTANDEYYGNMTVTKVDRMLGKIRKESNEANEVDKKAEEVV